MFLLVFAFDTACVLAFSHWRFLLRWAPWNVAANHSNVTILWWRAPQQIVAIFVMTYIIIVFVKRGGFFDTSKNLTFQCGFDCLSSISFRDVCVVTRARFQLAVLLGVLRRLTSYLTSVDDWSTSIVMSPVKNQIKCAELRQEASNLHKVWLPVCRIWWILLCPCEMQVVTWATRVQRHRDGPVFVSVANVLCTLPYARIQFCTRCSGRLLSMSSRRESLETDIRISSHYHVIELFRGYKRVCVVSVWDSGDTREGGRIRTRDAVRVRRYRNVRKLGQNMKMTTTLRDNDTTGHGRARAASVGVCRSYGKRNIDECPERRHFRTHWSILIKSVAWVVVTDRVSAFVLRRSAGVVVAKRSMSWIVLTWNTLFPVKCWDLDKDDVLYVKRIYTTS